MVGSYSTAALRDGFVSAETVRGVADKAALLWPSKMGVDQDPEHLYILAEPLD